MPLDAASHLASQGWGGAGKPLRSGPNALSRPIVGVQKKTLGGVGKDRDDAFAFWDHVYAVSAQSIKIKVHNDSDTEEEQTTSSRSSPPAPQIDRTSTGLISNRRPTGSQTPVSTSTSGTSTPVALESSSPAPRVSVMAAAKKQAARLELYRRFYVGPVIGPEDGSESKASFSKNETCHSGAQSSEGEASTLSITQPTSAVVTIVIDEYDAVAERKAAKAAKKAAREAKRERKEEKRHRKAERAALKEKNMDKAKKERRKQPDDVVERETSSTVPGTKKRKREDDGDETAANTDTKGKPVSPSRKKKRVKLIMSNPPPFVKHTPSLKPCDKKGILRTSALDSTKEQSGSDGEKSKKVTFKPTVTSHTVERWWEEAGWSDDGI
ncbi:hypothetical protein FRB90_006663 [Tulasnella sp. 427]|nr:hypothetical protein FRB90_006663 [Tulasnella sp. 427]